LFCAVFFQAEVGIRDRNVTGVQTCGLPIYGSLGGVKMTEADETSLQQLALKVQQHEKTIAQLVEIFATTNGRISELVDTLKDPQYYSNNLHVSSPER